MFPEVEAMDRTAGANNATVVESFGRAFRGELSTPIADGDVVFLPENLGYKIWNENIYGNERDAQGNRVKTGEFSYTNMLVLHKDGRREACRIGAGFFDRMRINAEDHRVLNAEPNQFVHNDGQVYVDAIAKADPKQFINENLGKCILVSIPEDHTFKTYEFGSKTKTKADHVYNLTWTTKPELG